MNDDNLTDSERAIKLLYTALKNHFRQIQQRDFVALQLQHDIKILSSDNRSYTLHKGFYAIQNIDNILNSILFILHPISIETELGETEELEDGTIIEKARQGEPSSQIKLEFALKPILISDNQITLATVCAWAALNDALETSNTEVAQLITHEIFKDTVQIRYKEEFETINAITKPLDKKPIIYNFATKGLKGIEDIAFGEGDGTYTLTAKNNERQRVELRANPKACRDYIANDGANWEYVALIIAIIYRLIDTPEAATMRTNGRVWITTNTILKELTRTAQGFNENAPRDKKFKQIVIDCLKMLSSLQITSYDACGKLQFMGYILQVEYLAEAKDKAGNIIKDIWGFNTDKDSLQYAALTAESTKNTPLLHLERSSLNRKNAWIPQVIRADILSEIRTHMYPKRGKGCKDYTATRSWNEIFKSAEVKADGNISSRRKETIIRDFEEQLKAYAEFERNEKEHIYIEAHSVRDGGRGKGRGAWEKLVIIGHKTYKKYSIDLF